MDNRLYHIFGRRPSRLRQQDLPDVAFALTVLARRLVPVRVDSADLTGAKVITLTSEWFAVAVLLEDWLKIEPHIQEGFFSPVLYPVPGLGRPSSDQLARDPLYNRILSVLTLEFPDSYPTSDL